MWKASLKEKMWKGNSGRENAETQILKGAKLRGAKGGQEDPNQGRGGGRSGGRWAEVGVGSTLHASCVTTFCSTMGQASTQNQTLQSPIR